SLTYKVWSVDTNIVKSPITGDYDLVGLPGMALDSVTVNFAGITGLQPNTGNFGVGFFTTPLYNFQSSIYAGYEITTLWDSLGGDTVSLAATSIRTAGTTDKDHYGVTKGGDTVVITRGAYEVNNTWYDYAYDFGYNLYLSIAPLVNLTSNTTENVRGIQNNNLTFFGTYPNPATTSTNIKFSLKNSADVTVYVSDMTGRLIKTIEQADLSSGDHIVTLNTSDL